MMPHVFQQLGTLLVIALLVNAQAETEDECENNWDCGSNQICNINDMDVGVCSCQQNYVPDSGTGECVLDSTECRLDVNCALNQICLMTETDGGYCSCQVGFTMNLSTGECVLDNIGRCQSGVDCGFNQICSIADGSCICQEGFTMNPTTGECMLEPESFDCNVDSDCPSFQACSMQDNGVGVCMCQPGYVRLSVSDSCIRRNRTANRSCIYGDECDINEMCALTSRPNSRICLCRPGFVFDHNLGLCSEQWLAGFTNQTCVSNADCGSNEQCMSQIADSGRIEKMCTCHTFFVYDRQQSVCREQRCDEWCYTSWGDTCRWNQCLTCWSNGLFVCNEFVAPSEDTTTVVIFRRSSYMSIWMMSIFFTLTVLLMFACVWKRRSVARPAAVRRSFDRRTFAVEQRADVHDDTCIKIPLDTPLNATALYAGQQLQRASNDFPPPYTRPSQQ